MPSPFDYCPDNWNRSRDALITVENRLKAGEIIEHSDYGFPLRMSEGVYPAMPSLSHTANNVFSHLAQDQSGKRVLDLGTGTGTFAIGVAHRGASEVIASDIEPKSVASAQFNLTKNPEIKDRVKVFESDLFDSIPDDVLAPGFDLIIANLMFPVMTPEFIQKSLEIRIPVYRRLLNEMDRYMRDGATLLLTSSNAANTQAIFDLFDEMSAKPNISITPHRNDMINVDMNWILLAFNRDKGPAKPAPY